MKLLYQQLRTQIENNTSAKHVRLWNNQVGLSANGEQIPYLFPAVFIDFPNIAWMPMGKGTQRSDMIMRFYLVFESFTTAENEEDLAIFDFREEVYLALQDFKPTLSGKLVRVAEQTDPNHDMLYVWVFDFLTQIQDKVATFPRNSIEGEIDTLILDTDLIINSNTVDGVRTDETIP